MPDRNASCPSKGSTAPIRVAVAASLAASLLLAACGSGESDASPKAAAGKGGPALQVATPTADWRRLSDGSFARTATAVLDDRREADRCWPDAGRFDCLSLDEIPYQPRPIVVATRVRPASYADVPIAPPADGFSCAIYPSGVVEQRLIEADGGWRRNDDIDGALWSAVDVAGFGAGDGFVDCATLAPLLRQNKVDALAGDDFTRDRVLPSA